MKRSRRKRKLTISAHTKVKHVTVTAVRRDPIDTKLLARALLGEATRRNVEADRQLCSGKADSRK